LQKNITEIKFLQGSSESIAGYFTISEKLVSLKAKGTGILYQFSNRVEVHHKTSDSPIQYSLLYKEDK